MEIEDGIRTTLLRKRALHKYIYCELKNVYLLLVVAINELSRHCMCATPQRLGESGHLSLLPVTTLELWLRLSGISTAVSLIAATAVNDFKVY